MIEICNCNSANDCRKLRHYIRKGLVFEMDKYIIIFKKQRITKCQNNNRNTSFISIMLAYSLFS